MKYIARLIIAMFLLIGYIFNMDYLTTDNEIRDYQWINKVGVVLVPIGSIMGYVYAIDTYKECKKKKESNSETKTKTSQTSKDFHSC